MKYSRFSRLSALLMVSLGTTVLLLTAEGRWHEAIPLHLCSLAALAATALALKPSQALLDFLWYLGMPGAALALIFPAPAVSRFQGLLTGSYLVTHLLILVIPSFFLASGMLPRRGKTARMLALLLCMAGAADVVNPILGTDFLFLAAPPAGTPLECIFTLGMGTYRVFLLGMMTALCLIMDRAAGWLHRMHKA